LILVGNEAGGGYDTMARLFARHLGDHIPGRPSVVVQNMPGAGGLSAANYFVNVAPQDGTELALVARTALLARMIAPKLVHFDVSKFNWLGTLMSEPGVLVVWRTAPVQSAADLFHHTLIVGGAGRMDDTEATPKLLNALLGAKLKVVGGYPGLNSVTNAMERGELEGVVDWSWSNAKQVKPQYLRDHLAHVIMQLDTHRAADLPDVPIPSDFAKDPRTKQLFQIYFTTKTVSRPLAAPPGAPADRVALLRTAFAATIADPAFLADAAKSHIPVAPSPYEKVLAAMRAINEAPPQLVQEMTGIFAKN
jgi:tripartite-type tricarboxylate transporter receptor subunit TctC